MSIKEISTTILKGFQREGARSAGAWGALSSSWISDNGHFFLSVGSFYLAEVCFKSSDYVRIFRAANFFRCEF